MGFENSAGIDVSNHYGPRDTGGTEGTTKTEGIDNEFLIDLDNGGLDFGFPIPSAFTNQGSFFVTLTDDTQATGTVTAVTIGGVAVLAATIAAPVEITSANTGVIVVTGATGGNLLIKYSNYPQV